MKKDVYQEVTDKIIAQMESLQGGWIKPFTASAGGGMPQNASTKAYYQGINILMLGMFNTYSSNEWASYKQWQGKGAQVRKGEKGTPIVFFKMLEKKKKGANGQAEFFPLIRYSSVFNAEQVDGYEPAKPADDEQLDLTERLALVDSYIAATQATIVGGNRGACYVPSMDHIEMPERSAFLDTECGTATEHFYSVELHELTHWTGHKDRLNRLDDRSKHGYAFEELIAELGASFQCVRLGINSEPREDHARYLASWIKALKSDKKFIFQAAAKAQKAVEFMDALQPAVDVQEAA